mmetsp:Transcript_50203/g.79947  ORF Transcript_50203/g.79947 Transcript_50203/m.79947 type:complete len:360 (-) Transcript_50203:33-1112(-)
MGTGKLHIFSPYGCSWGSNAKRIADWIVIVILIIIVISLGSSKPHKQCVPGLDSNCGEYLIEAPDAMLGYPEKDSTVPFSLLNIVSPLIWLAVFASNVFVICCYHALFQQPSRLYHMVLLKAEILIRSISMSALFTQLTTDVIKNGVGRPRPNYLNLHEQEPEEAIRSFPSGHASYVFSVMFILSLYLLHSLLSARKILYFAQSKLMHGSAQKTVPLSPIANDDSGDDIDDEYQDEDASAKHKASLFASEIGADIEVNRIINVFNGDAYFFVSWFVALNQYTGMFPIFVVIAPTLFATYVACTRLTDFKHHYSDVLGGAFIGIAYSSLSFVYYHSEFYHGFSYNLRRLFADAKASKQSA